MDSPALNLFARAMMISGFSYMILSGLWNALGAERRAAIWRMMRAGVARAITPGVADRLLHVLMDRYSRTARYTALARLCRTVGYGISISTATCDTTDARSTLIMVEHPVRGLLWALHQDSRPSTSVGTSASLDIFRELHNEYATIQFANVLVSPDMTTSLGGLPEGVNFLLPHGMTSSLHARMEIMEQLHASFPSAGAAVELPGVHSYRGTGCDAFFVALRHASSLTLLSASANVLDRIGDACVSWAQLANIDRYARMRDLRLLGVIHLPQTT